MELYLFNPQYITKIRLHLPGRHRQTVKPGSPFRQYKERPEPKKGPGAPLTASHQHISGHGTA